MFSLKEKSHFSNHIDFVVYKWVLKSFSRNGFAALL